MQFLLCFVWVCSVSKMLPSVKFAEDKMPTFLIVGENAKIVQL